MKHVKTQEETDAIARRAKYEEEQERKHEEQRQRNQRDVDSMEIAIAPLKFDEMSPANRQYLFRTILSPEGEQLGTVHYSRRGYYAHSPMKWRVTSKRIRNRSRYSSGGGHRDYTKFDSAVAAIKKFCIAKSPDEDRARELRQELQHYRSKVSRSSRRHRLLDHSQGYGRSPDADALVDLLASDIPQNYLEGQAYLAKLIRQKKVHWRYAAWVTKTFIADRELELSLLDLSKENVK